MPIYANWTVKDLESAYIRYREILQEMVESTEYRRHGWLAQKSPDLGDKIQEMLFEKDTERQARLFNNIVFELSCAIEVITGAIKCSERDWDKLIAGRLPNTG